MKHCLGWMMAIVLLPAQAEEIGIHYAESLPTEDHVLRLVSVRLGTALPWQWDLSSGWVLFTRFDAALARAEESGGSTILFGAGPALRLVAPSGGWYLGLGWRPSYLGQDRFGALDLGGQLQFETSLGAGYWLTERLHVNYEITHVSNGGLEKHNPGWNGQRLGLNYDF